MHLKKPSIKSKRIKFLLAVFSASFLFSCASNPYLKSIKDSNLKELLERSPKQEQHPNAGAILLYNYTCIEMMENGTTVTREVTRYKIFNERGYTYASKSIGYREGYQEVKVLFANTIKPDGIVVKLEEKDIMDFSPYAKYEFYTDIKEKKFTMPAIEPGCILEYCDEIKEIKTLLPYDLFSLFICRSEQPIKEDIMEFETEERFEVIVSDLAAHTTGIEFSDVEETLELCWRALEIVKINLVKGGSFVCKIFEGEGTDEFFKEVEKNFEFSKRFKPKASRKQSREMYIVAMGFGG